MWRRVLRFVNQPISYPRWLLTLLVLAAVLGQPAWVAVFFIIVVNVLALFTKNTHSQGNVGRSDT